jgi:hypothetical protein
MRRNAEINRVEDVRIARLELVHVVPAADPARHEVTALITFEARVSFVHHLTGQFLRGSHTVGLYQEFWVFQGSEDVWRLESIERTHESARLAAENRVDPEV